MISAYYSSFCLALASSCLANTSYRSLLSWQKLFICLIWRSSMAIIIWLISSNLVGCVAYAEELSPRATYTLFSALQGMNLLLMSLLFCFHFFFLYGRRAFAGKYVEFPLCSFQRIIVDNSKLLDYLVPFLILYSIMSTKSCN